MDDKNVEVEIGMRLRAAGFELRDNGIWSDTSGDIGVVIGLAGAFVGWLDVLWPHPSTPRMVMRDLAHIPDLADFASVLHDEIEAAQRNLAAAMVHCTSCRQPTKPGHMLDNRTCQSCGARELGIVF